MNATTVTQGAETATQLAPYMLYIYAALGAIILWGKMNKKAAESFSFSKLTEPLITNAIARMLVELLIFACMGSFLSVALSGAQTAPQAIAAGLGWTHLIKA